MGEQWSRVFDNLRNEWHEAPWFVLLVIGLSALVATIAFPAMIDALAEFF